MTARSAAEIRADLADCDRDGLPWPSAARRLLADVPALLECLDAVKGLHFPYDCTEAGNEGHETCGEREWCYSCGEEQPWPCTTFQAIRDAALSAAPQPQPTRGCACGVTTEHRPHEFDLDAEPAKCAHGEYEAHALYRPDSGTYAVRCPGPAPEQSR